MVAVAAVLLELAMAALRLSIPGTIGALGAGIVLCWVGFTLWPAAILPAGIIGGTVAGYSLGGLSVRWNVAMHLVIVGAGGAAVLARRLLYPQEQRPQRTSADAAMVTLGLLTALGAVYGLSVGNSPWHVAVATYQIGIIPFYFFLATYTLTTPARLRAAAILYASAAGVITVLSFTSPGRHGGLVSLIAVPPLIVVAGQTRGWRRAAALGVAALFLSDVVLASFRGMWLAGGLTLLVMLLRWGPVIRRGLVSVAVTSMVLLLGALAVSSALRGRSAAIAPELHASSGYRLPESSVGLGVFAGRPFFGAGLGQSTPDTYLDGFSIVHVGPVYHAYYVTILANAGLVGLVAVVWPVLRTIPAGLARRDGMALAFAALTCGFLAAALFSAPTDGHWELGLLPALTLLTAGSRVPQGQPVRPERAGPHREPRHAWTPPGSPGAGSLPAPGAGVIM
ncbi:hypothetical protein GCM10023322_59350 [Rugosimonospora acidiphila]|uniref:O-antigen ligase domain-containing protein n=2 Tax=Rugosimonospora acidiphila TaxID=556531 RepID=A0ABP9SDQ8_9ACTN